MTPDPLPASARAVRTVLGDAVTAAQRRDPGAVADARSRVERLDPEHVRLVLGHVLRELVERTHPDGVDADDLSTLLQDVVRESAWCVELDPSALVAALTGAFGVHPEDDDEQPRPANDEIATSAALLVAHLLRGDDARPLLDGALAEVARSQTVELP